MPPRYAYWTILVDGQPTAFRASMQEELLPTFKRIKEKQPSAEMKWFQNGKLWESRIDAQEAMRARGELGRRGDERQQGFRSRDRDERPREPRVERRDAGGKLDWQPKGELTAQNSERRRSPQDEGERVPRRSAEREGGLDWKPKGEFTPAPKRAERPDWRSKSDAPARERKSEWTPKGDRPPFDRDRNADWKSRSDKPKWEPRSSERRWSPQDEGERGPRRSAQREGAPKPWSRDRDARPKPFARPAFKPSGDDSRPPKPEWKPKGTFDRERKPDWKPRGNSERAPRSFRPQAPGPKSHGRGEKLEWQPKGPPSTEGGGEKRKWVPKEEYKKSLGIEARRDKNWRPGGEHKDPKQKYKDAKKAKWTKFKKAVRSRWEGKKKS